MPSQIAGSIASSSSGSATLIMTRIGTPSRVRAGSRSPSLSRAVRATVSARVASKAAQSSAVGLSTIRPASPSTMATSSSPTSIGPMPTTIGTPRERASMATWLEALPANSARPPPPAQSTDRNRLGVTSSPASTAPGGVASSSCARQRPEHPVADIGEVGGAGAEIVVGGRLIVGDLDGDGVRPGGDGVDAFGDRGEGGRGQRVILQHRDLEIEDVGGFAFELFGQRRDRRDRSGDRGFEVGAFAGRVAGRLAPRRARTIEPHDRPGGDPGCGDATAPFNCRPHRLPPRRSPARPVRSGRRRHGRRRCRRRGCGDACPAGPWRPSP